jgi:hypothetical protein
MNMRLKYHAALHFTGFKFNIMKWTRAPPISASDSVAPMAEEFSSWEEKQKPIKPLERAMMSDLHNPHDRSDRTKGQEAHVNSAISY